MQKRIFLLTDGQVGNAYYVSEQAKLGNDAIRTHTFGIGSGCDKKMVIDVAKAGRGSQSLVLDNSSELNSKVISALANAFEPSLKGCKLIFGDKQEELNEVPVDVQEQIRDAKVVFSANEGPQTDFLAADEKDVLYGGAAGGGKSYAMLVDPLRYAHKKAHRALILRRSMPELREMIDKFVYHLS